MTLLDDIDRMILSLLSADSTLSYAQLGAQVNLSAPAVHERVKRLKKDGVIKAMTAKLDGEKLGRPLLSFVQVTANNIKKTDQVAILTKIPDIEEIHSVTGESRILLKVRTANALGLERVLEKINAIEGVTGTKSQVVLSTLLERGPSPDF